MRKIFLFVITLVLMPAVFGIAVSGQNERPNYCNLNDQVYTGNIYEKAPLQCLDVANDGTKTFLLIRNQGKNAVILKKVTGSNTYYSDTNTKNICDFKADFQKDGNLLDVSSKTISSGQSLILVSECKLNDLKYDSNSITISYLDEGLNVRQITGNFFANQVIKKKNTNMPFISFLPLVLFLILLIFVTISAFYRRSK